MNMITERRGVSWTLFRYLGTEIAFSFIVSFLFFFFIFFINQLLLMAEEILSKKVPFGQVALLILYSLPAIIAMAAPFASLVGTLMAIGRLSSDNEVLVILASGLSYRILFLPAILAGILISILSFFANDVLLPAGTLEFGKLYRKIVVSTPALELESNSVKRFKETVIVTGEAEREGISDVLILDRTGDGERRMILAKDARIQGSKGQTALSLDLNDAFIQSNKENIWEDYDYAQMSFLRYSISQEDMLQAIGTPGPREMSSRDVYTEIRKKEVTVEKRGEDKKRPLFNAALSFEGVLRKGPGSSSWNRRRNLEELFLKELSSFQETLKDRNLQVYRLEYYKKFSIPFGALSFVFLAVPLGLFAKKSGQSVGFAFGLIISVLYWAMLIGGQTMGVRLGYSPFWAMWLPNTLAVVLGIILSLRRIRQ